MGYSITLKSHCPVCGKRKAKEVRPGVARLYPCACPSPPGPSNPPTMKAHVEEVTE